MESYKKLFVSHFYNYSATADFFHIYHNTAED